jgi:glyoxylase-like metal-dependent hydrolase (beta-lactamase superfamily II)
VIDGVESVFGTPGGDLTSDRWAAIRRQQRFLDPQLLLRDVALGALVATEAGVAVRDGELRQRIEIADPAAPISLLVDRFSGEITDLETLENEHVTGDSELAVHYLGWRAFDGDVRFPSEVAITLGGEAVHVERRDSVTLVPPDPAGFALPAGAAPEHVDADADRGARNGQFHEMFAALGVPLDGLQTFVEPQQLAPGVFHVRGGSHHSLVVEQTNGIVVIEAPLYEARAQALLGWIATQFPGKPVTHVVATHHHRDHAGALRTFVARGARVVVGETARPFFARAFRAPRTLVPDELSAAPRSAVIDTVPIGGTLVLADATRPVEIVAIDSTHAADLVLAFVPAARVAFTSDIYSPGFPPNPAGARELVDAITAHGLAVDTLAGGHGGVGPRADLDAIAGR